MPLQIAENRDRLNQLLKEIEPNKIGFVPTMGALHSGHLSLIERAKNENEIVVVSLFVNPTQFNDPKDLQNYPRTPQTDIAMLEEAGVDILFMPSTKDIYPQPDTRVFDFGVADKMMEGESRPGHFNGVAQVVSRLFELIAPRRAYFGEKDFQQVAIVRAMVEQLGMDVEIIACPTIREPDGLAMSSRNALLDQQQRKSAPKIYAKMKEAVKLVTDNIKINGQSKVVEIDGREISPLQLEQIVTEKINSDPLLQVIYFKLVNPRTLQNIERWSDSNGIQGCIAVKVGEVRLIDNIRFV